MSRYQPTPSSSRSHDYPSSSSSISTSPTSAMDPDTQQVLERTEHRIDELLAEMSDPRITDEGLQTIRAELRVLTRTAADLRVLHLSYNPLGDFRLSSPKRKSPEESMGKRYQSILWDARQGIGKYAPQKSQPQRASTRRVANPAGKGAVVKKGRAAKSNVKVAGKITKAPEQPAVTSPAVPVVAPAREKPPSIPLAAPAVQEPATIPLGVPSVKEPAAILVVVPPLQEPEPFQPQLQIDEAIPPTPKRRRIPKVQPDYVTLDIPEKEPAVFRLSGLFQRDTPKPPSNARTPLVTEKSSLKPVNDRSSAKKPVSSAVPKSVQKRKSQKKDLTPYCLCREESHGSMVACDNEKCAVGWFHFGCVGLKRKPPGDWFCQECRNGNDAATRKV